jgi:hypothetical protein
MKLLCLDVPAANASMEAYLPHLESEVKTTWGFYKSGIVRDIYFRQDRPGVAIFVEAASVDAARSSLMELPLAKAGLIGWDIIPLGPFTNWELLFAPAHKA